MKSVWIVLNITTGVLYVQTNMQKGKVLVLIVKVNVNCRWGIV